VVGDTGAVDELRGGADEPERGDPPERGDRPEWGDGQEQRFRGGGSDVGAIRQRVEPRSRAEYAADLEQRVVSGWEQRAFGSRMDEPLDGWDGSGGADAFTAVFGTADGAVEDGPDGAGRGDTPLDAVRRFEPRRAGLPEVSAGDAVAYIDARHGERAWLAAARGCSPEVQRIFAALDQGGGHGHIRHEGWVTEELNERRVAYLEDPAQPDLAKRAAGIDGLRPDDRPHQCRQAATRITDPDAFAVAFARGTEHPKVRAALDAEFVAREAPRAVSLPVSDLLGAEGRHYCTGWRLQPVGASMKSARDQRAAWVLARGKDSTPDVPEPRARPVGSFEGGIIVFAFGPNGARDGYEIITMYPRQREDKHEGDVR
jgi:hypothetical protein